MSPPAPFVATGTSMLPAVLPDSVLHVDTHPLTPPDVISQSLLAVPMWLLFEVGVFFGRWVKGREWEEDA